ncbi:MAG: HAD-IA family hydrolase [Gammaproteobacteria bacterium]|nr:HAD-IA family hydrolase [Gammaproteobacteria bacterium]
MTASTQHVFFDLDGTMLDSAPGLVSILNTIRADYKLKAVEYSSIVPHISCGIDAILAAGFDHNTFTKDRQQLHQRFEQLYEENCCRGAGFYPGIAAVLTKLNQTGLGWSVISNKKEIYCRQILEHLGALPATGLVLGGDSLSRCKPEPDQLNFACRHLNIRAQDTLMIGDNIVDISAARACGASSALALWGYLPEPRHWRHWGADILVAQPDDLISLWPSR